MGRRDARRGGGDPRPAGCRSHDADLATGARCPGARREVCGMTRLWLSGLISARSMQFLGSIAGIAVTVAMLAAIGAFLSRSAATMTVRSIDAVPVDWQIAVLPGVDPAAVEQAVRDTVEVAGLDRVQYADVQA